VRAFGGNIDNVTIFGESAGGLSVSALLVSPLTKRLFHKAIVESGSGAQITTLEPHLELGRPIQAGTDLNKAKLDFFERVQLGRGARQP